MQATIEKMAKVASSIDPGHAEDIFWPMIARLIPHKIALSYIESIRIYREWTLPYGE
jgi:hypothetical protein